MAETVQGQVGNELAQLKLRFLSSLNHEIRSPLSGILGMMDLLLETPLSEEQREYTTTARLCAEELLEVMTAALEYSALSTGQTRLEESEFRLTEMVEGALRDCRVKAEAKGLKVRCAVQKDLPEIVVGDMLRLRQALGCLLGNAVKFTNRGRIDLVATGELLREPVLRLTLEVRDTGIGIAKDHLELIFESFRQLESGLTRSYPGLGLGLAVARGIVSLMSGEITADSEPGVGSVFRLTVPLRFPVEHPDAGRRRLATMHRVLVVEDNHVAQLVVSHILRRGRYEVHCAGGGAAALEAVCNESYDLILMDLQMPGMDGLETTAAIRRVTGYSRVPILALTANCSEEHRSHCREVGMQGFLTKPIHSEELLSAVSSYLPANR